MLAFEVIGNGELWVYMIIGLWVLGRKYDYFYFMSCFWLNLCASNILKPIMQSGRPIFDSKEFAMHMTECNSLDFGSPSGHALVTVHFMLNLWLFYGKEWSQYVPVKVLKTALFVVAAYVCACRVYLGRHTVD